MKEQHSIVTEILPILIPDNEYELGARLKQRIQAVFSSRNLPEFDPKKEGYPKFSVYLERLHTDIVRVVRIPGQSDVHVYKKAHSSLPVTNSAPTSALNRQNVVIRSDVWQAFLNPDVSRKRFFNKELKNITHFIPSQDSSEEIAVGAHPELFVEITPIPGSEQLGWMREFLANSPINEAEKQVISSQIGEKYSSALNATFINSLGSQGTLWRNHRIPRIISHIGTWAEQNKVPFGELCISPVSYPSQLKVGANQSAPYGDLETTEALSSKQLAHKLLDLMTEVDVAQMILPTIMNALLFKYRQ
ncbi:hypothetical protein [Serratia fonticola]|uniref:hypothetical protein n=1 Tax=Serratia fonticola TaxID=47917 RepID=UPI003AAD6200